MSVRSTLPRSSVVGPNPNPPLQAAEANPIDAELTARRSRAARRRLVTIYGLRVLFAVSWLGGWELSSRMNWVDPFFVGQPTGVVARLWTWITEGTALGPLWYQAAVTMEVIIPSALSWILASLHISFGLAIVGAVVGELFGATAGLGQLIYNAGHTFDVNGVFAGMFLLAVLALIAEGLISALEKRLIKWRPHRVSGEIPI